jgi:hypothetical protein
LRFRAACAGDVDDREPAQDVLVVAPLAADPFRHGQHADLFVVADVRDADPGTGRDLADRHLVLGAIHRFVLDLKLG